MKNKHIKNVLITLGMMILFHWVVAIGGSIFGLELYGGSDYLNSYFSGIYIGQTIIFSCLIFLILNVVFDKKE